MKALHHPNRASFSLDTRHVRLHAEVEVTPLGLGAIGVLVCGILLSVVPVIRASARNAPGKS